MTSPGIRVAGVVLAAGRSTRMGEPKALLTVGGRTFLERAIETLRGGGCEPIFAVLPPRTVSETMWQIGDASAVVTIANPERDSEPIDSIALAAGAAGSDVGALMILPVDHPKVEARTVRALIETYEAGEASIVRPVTGGRAGHPILIDRRFWSDFDADLTEGLRTLVRGRPDAVGDVPVVDPGILADIDTPADYAREIAAR